MSTVKATGDSPSLCWSERVAGEGWEGWYNICEGVADEGRGGGGLPVVDDNVIANQISGAESGILDTTVLNTEYIFSCTSNSNKRIKSTTKVLYEDCPINIGKNFIF